ncbi:MAG: lysyl-tRNA synthetase, class [Nocardioidaceae bacterium]|jgi:lysyl-tRNA synthetase class 2|nr:lysyl-tRNA synthetase, class [Nocardioidaceae bacterium]
MRWSTLRSPLWVGRIVSLVGLVTLLSALLPEVRSRMDLVNEMVPDVYPAAATTGAAAVGVILILLSRALRRGKFRAWLLATVLAGLAVGLHILKGLDVEEAAMCLAVFVLLLSARRNFTARPDPRSLGRLLAAVCIGTVTATALGYLWLAVDGDGQLPGTTQVDRVVQAFVGLVGLPGPVVFVSQNASNRAAVALVVLGASVLFVAVLLGLQPAGGPHPMTPTEQLKVRTILDTWGGGDSLAYFGLRGDRSVIFSASGKSAVTYRVVGTVSLVAGDPIGDPEAWPGAIQVWLNEATSFGWVPAVIGASERGAAAYHRAGLQVLEFGDEAILHADDFTLEGRNMRAVRQAVARSSRAGISVCCRRVRDLDVETLRQVREKVDAWREGPVERGFSMALGRLGADEDPQALLVLATEGDRLVGLLHFVPWGNEGLSLDLMRRDRDAENGVIEAMVAALMAVAPSFGIRRVSLNFAVFRSVFARGERLGAGPALRAWRAILLWASRFWQIESLYRANAKYQPEWLPRYVAYPSPSDIPRVATAALRAEAFLVAPAWLRKLGGP